MSKRKPNHYDEALQILQELHSLYPHYGMGRHLSTALADYGDVWGLTDKELVFALQKYMSQLEMDVPHEDDEEIEKIIRDGMDLDNLFKEEDNGDNY